VRDLDYAARLAWVKSHVQRGIRYLSNEDVVTLAKIKYRLLMLADDAECAALDNETLPDQDVRRLFNELGKRDRAALNSLMTLCMKAATKSLRARQDQVFPVTETDVADAMGVLHEAILEEDLDRFDRITDKIIDNDELLSDEEQCWDLRTMGGAITKLNEPFRSKLARLIVGQEFEN
jgi:hypothetical protein